MSQASSVFGVTIDMLCQCMAHMFEEVKLLRGQDLLEKHSREGVGHLACQESLLVSVSMGEEHSNYAGEG